MRDTFSREGVPARSFTVTQKGDRVGWKEL